MLYSTEFFLANLLQQNLSEIHRKHVEHKNQNIFFFFFHKVKENTSLILMHGSSTRTISNAAVEKRVQLDVET